MADQTLQFSRNEVLHCIQSLHAIITSLERLSRASAHLTREEYAHELADFVDGWGVATRLSDMRSVALRALGDADLARVPDAPTWTEPPPRAAPVRKPHRRHRAG